MLRINLSASSPSQSEKTVINQADFNNSVSQTSSISPRSSDKSVLPQMRSHEGILHRTNVIDSILNPADSEVDQPLSCRLLSPSTEKDVVEKRKGLLGTLNFSLRTPGKSTKSKSGNSSPVVSPRSLMWSDETDAPASPRSPRKLESDPLRVDRHRVLSNSPRSPRASIHFSNFQKTSDAIESPTRNMAHRMSAPPVLIRAPLDALNATKLSELSRSVALAWIDAAQTDACKPKKSLQQKSPEDPTLSPRQLPVPVLTDSICNAFARSEYKIPKSALPADLLALLPSIEQEHVSHTALIKILFTPKLKESPAGKTMRAMKATVMQQHSADGLKIGEPVAEARKKSATTAMQSNAAAIIDVCFGMDTKCLSSSQLPNELIEFWKTADSALVAWALDNPDLSAEKIASVRSNLGIDIILTRQIYPMIFGHQDEAQLAVPGWFGGVVRKAAMEVWPEFFNDFVKTANLTLTPPLQAALAERATPKLSADMQVQNTLPEKSDKKDLAD